AGGEALEAQREDAVQHQAEADEGVAAQARVRRAALEISLVEGLDDALAELPLQGPDVEGDADQGRDPAGGLDGRQRAAAPMDAGLVLTSPPLLERDPDHAVALRRQQRRGDAGRE